MTSMEAHLSGQLVPQSATFNALANQGSQIGHNSGSITNNFHAGPIYQPLTPVLHIPFRRDRDFIDRRLLAEVRQRAAQPAARVGLIGLGGVGKTQLAIEYAYQCRDADPKLSVFWVHASSVTRFYESYRTIAQRLQLNGWDDPQKDMLPSVHAWLSNENNGRWTMVIDNADNTDVMFGTRNRDAASQPDAGPSISTRSISGYLPCSNNGSIIFTSRSREVVKGLIEYADDILQVDAMMVDEGAALLSRKLKSENLVAPQDDLMNLVRELDCMPLAITQAASYINQQAPRMSASHHLEDLIKNDVERMALLEQAVRDPRRDEHASNSIIVTWHISFEHLRQTRDSAARLLALMCLFDRDSIPQDLLVGRYLVRNGSKALHNLDQSQLMHCFQNDITTLCAYSLIRVGFNNQVFYMQRLVQYSVRRWLESYGELAQWQIHFAALLDNMFPQDTYYNCPACQMLLPHVESLMSYKVENDDFVRHCTSVADRAAWYMLIMGKYDIAERLARESLARRKQSSDLESVEVLASIDQLAIVLSRQSKYVEAEQLHRQVLTRCENLLGVGHSYTTGRLQNLAVTLLELGQYEQAESMLRQALMQYEQVSGTNQAREMNCMANLGLALKYQGKHEDAEELTRKALALYKAELGFDHCETWGIMNQLASVLHAQGQFQQAEKLYRQSLAGTERILGINHPELLMGMSNLVLVLMTQGLHKEAEDLERRILASREKELGTLHKHTLLSVWSLADTRWCQHDFDEALTLYQRAIGGFTQIFGLTHPITQNCIQQKKQALREKDDRLKAIDASDLN